MREHALAKGPLLTIMFSFTEHEEARDVSEEEEKKNDIGLTQRIGFHYPRLP